MRTLRDIAVENLSAGAQEQISGFSSTDNTEAKETLHLYPGINTILMLSDQTSNRFGVANNITPIEIADTATMITTDSHTWKKATKTVLASIISIAKTIME